MLLSGGFPWPSTCTLLFLGPPLPLATSLGLPQGQFPGVLVGYLSSFPRGFLLATSLFSREVSRLLARGFLLATSRPPGVPIGHLLGEHTSRFVIDHLREFLFTLTVCWDINCEWSPSPGGCGPISWVSGARLLGGWGPISWVGGARLLGGWSPSPGWVGPVSWVGGARLLGGWGMSPGWVGSSGITHVFPLATS